MADIAALGFAIDTDPLKQATAELRAMAPAATAAEKAAQRWGNATTAASRSTEDFSRRVQGTIKSLEFERAQLARSADERERYAAIRRAGVSESSAEGRAIMASVAALQQEKAARQAAAESIKLAQQQAAGYAAAARQRAAEEVAAIQQRVAQEAAAAAERDKLLRQEQAQREAMAAKQAAQEAQRRAAAAAVVADLNFERQQLKRTADEQAKYAALRRAGVSASSAEGKAIVSSVAALQQQRDTQQAIAALQAQRAAVQGVTTATTAAGRAAAVAAGAFRTLWLTLGPLAIAMLAVQQAMKAWDAGMKAANLGEEAEQVNLTTDALQAFRFAAVQNGVEVATLDQAMIRLTASMGKAAEGSKDQIEMFQKLGVKLLDSNGKLRATADVLPEVARGLLAMESGTERNAALTEIFGKSGARVVTMLGDWAQGTDAVINKARAQGGVLDAEVIAQWDKVSDSLAKAGAAADVTLAKLGAPIATWALEKVAALLESINANLAKLKQEAASVTVRAAKNDTSELENQIAAQRGLLAINPNNQSALASIKGLEARLEAARNAEAAAERAMQQGDIQMRGAPSSGVSQVLPTITVSSEGARDPVAKASGAAKGLSEAEKAAKKLSDWMRDANASAEAFLANQEVQRQSLFLSAEAASALKIETDFLNKAKADDITLTEEQRATLHDHAAAMAASEEKTRQLTEAFEFAKDVTSGFFADFAQGLREGQSLLDSFGNAALNVLNKIADKLISMAVNDLVNQAFGGKGGSSGGFLSGILGLFGIGGGVTAGPAPTGGYGGYPGYASTLPGFANGAAFQAGNVIPFARGGVVSRPTLFPMANGMGLMGEAGPEAVVPLRRGRNGKLGIEASGGGGVVVNFNVINNADGTKVTKKESKGPGGQINIDVIVDAVDSKIAGKIDRDQSAIGKVLSAKHGLQRQGH